MVGRGMDDGNIDVYQHKEIVKSERTCGSREMCRKGTSNRGDTRRIEWKEGMEVAYTTTEGMP
jgi:hypothetical protein